VKVKVGPKTKKKKGKERTGKEKKGKERKKKKEDGTDGTNKLDC